MSSATYNQCPFMIFKKQEKGNNNKNSWQTRNKTDSSNNNNKKKGVGEKFFNIEERH